MATRSHPQILSGSLGARRARAGREGGERRRRRTPFSLASPPPSRPLLLAAAALLALLNGVEAWEVGTCKHCPRPPRQTPSTRSSAVDTLSVVSRCMLIVKGISAPIMA